MLDEGLQSSLRAKKDARTAILDAARDLFLAKDHRAVSARRIAQKAGYSPMVLYRHFVDMQDILIHLIDEGFAILGEKMESIQEEDPIERLRQAGLVYLKFAADDPRFYRIMFQLDDQRLTDNSFERSPNQERVYQFLYNSLLKAIESGRVKAKDDPMVLFHVLWSGVHGGASLLLTARLQRLSTEQREAFAGVLVDRLLLGLEVEGAV